MNSPAELYSDYNFEGDSCFPGVYFKQAIIYAKCELSEGSYILYT